VTKLVTPDEKQSALFKLVSYITGFKNSLKGVGYFIGAGCLAASDQWGYYLALGINVCALNPELSFARHQCTCPPLHVHRMDSACTMDPAWIYHDNVIHA